MGEKQRDIILFAFKDLDEVHGRTFIQKLFFIITQQVTKLSGLFEYYPYNYGPFSNELNQSVNELIEEDFIEERRVGSYFTYKITEKGRKEANNQKSLGIKEQQDIAQICTHVKHFTPRKILEYVYRKYPETTVNSLLKKKNP